MISRNIYRGKQEINTKIGLRYECVRRSLTHFNWRDILLLLKFSRAVSELDYCQKPQ